MPHYFEKSLGSDGEIAVWKITETVDELVQLFTGKELPEFRSEARRMEWMATRLLLESMGIHDDVVYDDNGKPTFKNSELNLSISHSVNYVAIIIHKKLNVGIDIEKTGDRIFRVQHKFVNEKERGFIKEETLMQQLYVIWGAKECAFKIHSVGEVDFSDNLEVSPFEFYSPGETSVLLKKAENVWEFAVFYQYLDEMMLTYAIAS